jgi:hypothetical protein
MADLPPIVQEFRAEVDTRPLIRFARTVEKHFGALADDLEQFRDSDGAERRKAVHEPGFPPSTPGAPFRPTTEIMEGR